MCFLNRAFITLGCHKKKYNTSSYSKFSSNSLFIPFLSSSLSHWLLLYVCVPMCIYNTYLYIISIHLCNIYINLYNKVREGNGTPLQYSCLENPMDGGAWEAVVHGVAKSWTRLSDFTFTFHFHALEKEMATHSSVLAWRLPGTVEPGGLPSIELHRVRYDWSDLAAAAA